ncbi:PREDICTED: coiled-coil domain-containing protein 158-like isoform X1 [Poecilia mexicana]|uniref:coiled-coil domain-containing protein 158-like isoform X1 n=2 Tax=Poecilia mexicana TaxID=48701 RepID=UPI00072EF0B0|nr:PREDICTED: coiled-coil domain-containing protein 158-like isoform X1 [Poecilia mexicana]
MSNSKPPGPQKPHVGTDSYFLTFGDSPVANDAADRVTQSASLSLRFNRTLDELSEELNRQTMEIQDIREEIQNAPSGALRRFGSPYRNRSPERSCHKNDSAEESAGFSAHIETLTQAIVDCMDTLKQDEVQRDRGSSEMDALENAAEQLSHLQLNKAHTEEEETFSPQRAIMHLKSKLHEAQMENDALTDLRLKDSRKQVSQMAKMLHLLEELQKVKMSKVWKLPETEEEAFALQREVESLAKCVRRVYHILYEKQFGDNSAGNKTVKHQEPQSGYENVHKETDKQHWTYFRSKDQQRNSEYEGLNNQERMENLIASLDQEVAMFTDKSKHPLCNKLRLLKNLAESQTSVQLCQISELELTVSSYRDKVSYLEKKMLETETELFATHKERDQSLQQVKELQSQLQLLKSVCEKQQLEFREDMKTLRGQLESTRKQLFRAGEEKSCLQMLTEQRSQECQILQAELAQQKSEVVRLDRERRELQNSLTDQNQHLHQETLDKQQAVKQMELQRLQLFNLNKQLENLQRLHSCKNEEHEGVVLQLQSQLGSAHDELHKIRRSLRTLKAADGHGLQVALDMQKEITAKREKIDAMQSRIQHLEEKVEKLQQEKCRLNLEAHHQLQDLTFAREEKRQLGSELKALRSKDHQLRERIVELEGILHKMCESLANCQDFLQLREQEHFRLKLQHALNLKELQVGSLCTCSAPSDLNCRTRSVQSAPPSPRLSFNTQIKESSKCERRALVKEKQADDRPHSSKYAASRRMSAPERPHAAAASAEDEEGLKDCSSVRRKTFDSKQRFLEATELDGQTVNNRDGLLTSSPVISAKYNTFPLSLSRRSPVHTLLTSDPNSYH